MKYSITVYLNKVELFATTSQINNYPACRKLLKLFNEAFDPAKGFSFLTRGYNNGIECLAANFPVTQPKIGGRFRGIVIDLTRSTEMRVVARTQRCLTAKIAEIRAEQLKNRKYGTAINYVCGHVLS